jgi:hypothetical protein
MIVFGAFPASTHLHDEEQLSGGLYGPLIVVEPGTKFDPAHEPIAILSRAGPGPIEGPLLLNGSSDPPPLHWRTGDRYRLRLISIAAFDGGTSSLLGRAGHSNGVRLQRMAPICRPRKP